MRLPRTALSVSASLALGVGTLIGIAAPDAAANSQTIHWSPVKTVWAGSFENLASATTDNGLVVAVWSDHGYRELNIAVRPAGGSWSAPTMIDDDAGAFVITKAGDGAWIAWQGSRDVKALQVDPDGSLETPTTIGESSDPFTLDLHIAVGANGAVAANWHTHLKDQARLAYRPAGGSWGASEVIPIDGYVEGLVVGAAGVAQVVTSDGPLRHETLTYDRRTADGTWRQPVTISSDSFFATVTGNPEGDIVVGWENVVGNKTNLVARYKAADEKAFGDAHHLRDGVPENTTIAFGMAADGSLASVYETTEHGDHRVQMTPANSTGDWLKPQDLPLPGGDTDVAMNPDGSFVVVHQPYTKGTMFIRCDSYNVCGDVEANPATGYKSVSASVGPNGVITLVWGRGCKGEACNPTSVVAQRGH